MSGRQFECDRCETKYTPYDDMRAWAGDYAGGEFGLICDDCHRELMRN